MREFLNDVIANRRTPPKVRFYPAQDAPLSADFHFRNPALYWSLGPYADGKYSAVIANGVQAFEIPRRDALKLPGMAGISLRIRYDSPAGWTTYSPEIAIDFARKPDVMWHR